LNDIFENETALAPWGGRDFIPEIPCPILTALKQNVCDRLLGKLERRSCWKQRSLFVGIGLEEAISFLRDEWEMDEHFGGGDRFHLVD